jgi:hypothetical protein
MSQFQPSLPASPPPLIRVSGDCLTLFLHPGRPADLAMQAGEFAHVQPAIFVDLLLEGEALPSLLVDKGLPLGGIA